MPFKSVHGRQIKCHLNRFATDEQKQPTHVYTTSAHGVQARHTYTRDEEELCRLPTALRTTVQRRGTGIPKRRPYRHSNAPSTEGCNTSIVSQPCRTQKTEDGTQSAAERIGLDGHSWIGREGLPPVRRKKAVKRDGG